MGDEYITHEKKECDGKNKVKNDTRFRDEGFIFFWGHMAKMYNWILGVKPNLTGPLRSQ